MTKKRKGSKTSPSGVSPPDKVHVKMAASPATQGVSGVISDAHGSLYQGDGLVYQYAPTPVMMGSYVNGYSCQMASTPIQSNVQGNVHVPGSAMSPIH